VEVNGSHLEKNEIMMENLATYVRKQPLEAEIIAAKGV
jgi:hypothetical protein